ncbi:MAG: hypothetical protein WC393_00505 [Candidatus Nanoarchaeia archaeon]|jgi:hypothetical protein
MMLLNENQMNFDNGMEEVLINNYESILNQLNSKDNKNRHGLLVDNAFAVSGIKDKELDFYYTKFFEAKDLILKKVDLKNDYKKASSLQKAVYSKFIPKKHSPELSNAVKNYTSNCIGLTTIYSIFALNIGLDVELVTNNKGLHFFNKVIISDKEYYVDCVSDTPDENINKKNYEDYKVEIMLLKLTYGEVKGAKLSDLLSAVYRSRAYKETTIDKKMELYKKALLINPEDELAKKFILKIK